VPPWSANASFYLLYRDTPENPYSAAVIRSRPADVICSTTVVRAAAMACLALLAVTPARAGPANGPDRDAYAHFLAPASVCPSQAERSLTVRERSGVMRCLVNWARWRNGLLPLQRSRRLDRSSQIKAVIIRACREFSHTACGLPFEWVFDQVDYGRRRAWKGGENLAWGAGPRALPREVMRAWLHSPAHRIELFDRRWHDLGVALVRAGGLFGYPKVGIWVTQFGRRF
jgi:uncharacterized protein YkwD